MALSKFHLTLNPGKPPPSPEVIEDVFEAHLRNVQRCLYSHSRPAGCSFLWKLATGTGFVFFSPSGKEKGALSRAERSVGEVGELRERQSES